MQGVWRSPRQAVFGTHSAAIELFFSCPRDARFPLVHADGSMEADPRELDEFQSAHMEGHCGTSDSCFPTSAGFPRFASVQEL